MTMADPLPTPPTAKRKGGPRGIATAERIAELAARAQADRPLPLFPERRPGERFRRLATTGHRTHC
jgi:hypothetical protein